MTINIYPTDAETQDASPDGELSGEGGARRTASIAVSWTQVFKSRPKTKPPITNPPELLRMGPRRQLPSDGPVKPNDSGSVCPVEVLLSVFTLHAPDGALGVRRCLPLVPCACDTCDASDTLEALRPKSSAPPIEEDDDE